MKKKENRLPVLSMAGVVVSGIVICILAIYFVSQQKNVRIIDTRNDMNARMVRLRDDIETRIRQLLAQVNLWTGENVQSRSSLLDDPDALRDLTKTMVLNHPVITYPFIIDSRRRFIFPLSRKAVIPEVAPGELKSRPMSPPVKQAFIRAYRLEFDDKNLTSAIKEYLQALDKNPSPVVRPYILNAVARCYRKLEMFPQAIRYYETILALLQPGPGKDRAKRILYYSVLRLTAQSYGRINAIDDATRFYLRLYDQLQQDNRGSGPLEYYKNEALAYLKSHLRPDDTGKNPPNDSGSKNENKESNSALSRLKNSSQLDISLQWLYFEADTQLPGSPGNGNDGQALRFIKLRDLYEFDDRKTRFYQTVKHSLPFPDSPGQAVSIHRLHLAPGGSHRPGTTDEPVEAVYIVVFSIISSHPEHGRIFAGFLLSPQFVRDRVIARETQRYFQDPVLSVDFFKAGTHPLFTVPLKEIFPDRSLALYASEENYIGELVKRDIRLYYGLISVLIIVLLLGIFLFYKYIKREAQLVRLKSQFVDSASHTLKTPLTRISLLAENMAGGWIIDEKKQREYLNGIISETSRMGEMIDNLLNFSRIEEGRQHYNPQKTYLQEIVGELLDQYASYFENRRFEIDTDVDDTVPAVMLDTGAGRLIIGNLVQNAVKYSLEKKKITIRLYRENGWIVLEISDQGMGIPGKDLSSVFKKFSRAEDKRITAIEGSGLGLFLVHHAVEANGGKIDVRSKIDIGTTFTVRFPE